MIDTLAHDERSAWQARIQALTERNNYQAIYQLVEKFANDNTVHSDIVHDILARLAECMLTINKSRHQAIEYFILDLEGVVGVGQLQKIRRLWTPSGAIEPEAEQHLGDLAAHNLDLRDDIGRINEVQGKWMVKKRLKKLSNLSDVVKIYRQHHDTIAALDQRLSATDKLIDQIVYRPYGLTDAEIAIVEKEI